MCLEANFLIFSSFILLFLYSTVQKSAVQYSINLERARNDVTTLVFILFSKLNIFVRLSVSVLLHYNCKINANIQDVYHRPNLERARKGRLPLEGAIKTIKQYTGIN